MYCCRPRSTTKGRGISDHAPATTIGLADEGLHSGGPKKISPWSHYPPIETQPRHRVSRADIWDGRGDTDSTPLFDARKVNEACRAQAYSTASLTPAMRSETPGVLIPVKRQKDQIVKLPDTVKREIVALTAEKPQWWKSQFSDNRHAQKFELEERERRREISKAMFAAEQERQVAEILVNEIEEREDRNRRREFAKQALIEEQHTRVREQFDTEEREEVIRQRRRQWAIKALRTEEVRRTTDRLMLREVMQGRAEKRGDNLRLWREKEEQTKECARNHALFLYGVKLEVRCLEREIELGGVRSVEELGVVSQAILVLHARLCRDDSDSSGASERRAEQRQSGGGKSVLAVEQELRAQHRAQLQSKRKLCPSCS